MRFSTIAGFTAIVALATTVAASAEGFSSHVLDVARGTGGIDIPVTLERQQEDGSWRRLAKSRTDANGRVRSFGDDIEVEAAVYRLTFDMSNYADETAFFPAIDVIFQVTDTTQSYHVPIVVSPYGYSTYRGN